VGSQIILLRNPDPPKLCNGTRLCVKKMLGIVIEEIILTGKGEGETVFIPRIPLIPTGLPFIFKRLRFPVILAFAITINKSQGSLVSTAGWIWDRHVSLTDNFMLLAQGWVHPRIYLFSLHKVKLKMLFVIKCWVKLII
jgi:hypothetical protein